MGTQMKVVFVGDGKTGKTAIFRTILNQEFDLMRSTKMPTVSKFVDQQNRELDIVDTPGGDNYSMYGKQQLAGAKAVIFFVSVDREESAKNIKKWKGIVEEQVSQYEKFLFINKTDIPEDDQAISISELINDASEFHNFEPDHIFETCNLDQSSANALAKVAEILYASTQPSQVPNSVDISSPKPVSSDSSCC